MSFKYVVPLCSAAAVTAFAAAAQQPARLPNPADATAAVPPLKYESPFAGYTPYRESGPQSWRDMNEAVRAAGGHKGMSAASGGSGHAGHGSSAPEAKPPAEPQPPAEQTHPPRGPSRSPGAGHH